MEGSRIPKPLLIEGNLSENFRRFKQSFEIYACANELSSKKPEVQAAILLNLIGEDALDLYNTFNLSEADSKDFEKILSAFENYMDPRKNVVVQRYRFNSRIQEPSEPFEHFLLDLKKLIKNCDFKDQQNSLLRDRLVLGVSDKALQERLLRDPDLPLDSTIKLCRAAELGKIQSDCIKNQISETNQFSLGLNTVRSKQSTFNRSKVKNDRPTHKYIPIHQKSSFSSEAEATMPYQCKKCNNKHIRANCPAYGKKCFVCGKLNHFAVGCKNKTVRGARELYEHDLNSFSVPVQNDGSFNRPNSNEHLIIDGIKTSTSGFNLREWLQVIRVEDIPIEFKVDTGAEVNILPLRLFRSVNNQFKVQPTNVILETYGGFKIKPEGTVHLLCENTGNGNLKYDNRPNLEISNNKIFLPFVIVNAKNENDRMKPILGLNGCIKLGLIKNVNIVNKIVESQDICKSNNVIEKEMFINKHKNVFEGIGKCTKSECHIELKENVRPVVKPPRRVPFSILSRLKDKLNQLVNEGIISKVDRPKNWVSNLVIIEKNDGSLRLCLDPQDLNKAIKREYCLIPTYDEIYSKLANKNVFSVLDLKDGFYHIPLDEESSHYCTFNSVFGLYKFNRLPFGLSNAAEIFQKINVSNFGDIPNVTVYIDDILIATSTEEEHELVLRKIMERANKLNIKFNKDKIQYKVNEVKFFGHIFSSKGVKPDPDRVSALQAIQDPKNKKELQRIMGLFNYLRSFIPNMAELTAPLRELLKKDVKFQWLPIHSEVLTKMKTLISEAPTLANFDDKKSLAIQCDSSKTGIGSCLLVEGKPMAFASRSLSESETRFSQVEKELLAIVYSVKKFHYYIYGRPIKVITDCKPLVAIMQKNVANVMSPRLQRLKTKLLKYDLNVEHMSGKFMFISDLLSRSYINSSCQNSDEFSEEIVHCIGLSKYVQISDVRKASIKLHTANDPCLINVMSYVKNGWPKHIKNVFNEAKCYFSLRNEITEDEGLLFYNDRVIIPRSLRNELLNKLHESHFGIDKTKARARQVVFWPGITKEIENFILSCSICEKFRSKNVREPLISHEIPELPFNKVGIDIFEFGGDSYLALVDYLSKWIEMVKLKSKSAPEIVNILQGIFSIHGIPEIVVADNVPFNSYICKKFAEEWNFKFVYSSPMYPKSNGAAERAVQTCKNILKKCKEGGKSVYVALLEYRNMPIYNLNMSPAQILFSRMLRTKVPVSNKLLVPQLQCNVKDKLMKVQERTTMYYNRNARLRQPFYTGENVVLLNNRIWEPGQIVKCHDAPRSYIVKNKQGVELRRNSSFLKKSLPNRDHHYDEMYTSPSSCLPSKSSPNQSPIRSTCQAKSKDRPTLICNDSLLTPTSVIPSSNDSNQMNGNAKLSRYGRIIKPRKLMDL